MTNYALQKVNIPIQFQGLDTNTASQLVVPGKFLVLENCVRRKSLKLQKRPGFSSLGTGIIGSSSVIESGNRIDKFGTDTLLLNEDSIYSYSDSNDKWIDRGELVSVTVESRPVMRNTASQSTADVAYGRGLTCYVWEDTRGGARFSVNDEETGVSIVYDTVLNASAVRPKVLAMRDGFVIFYQVSTTLYTRAISYVTPTSIGTETSFSTGVIAASPYDVTQYSTTIGAFAFNTSTNDIKVGYFLQSGAIGTGTNGAPSPIDILSATVLAGDALTILTDTTNQKLYVLYYDDATSTNVTVSGITADLFTVVTETIEAIADVRNIIGAINDAGVVQVYYEVSGATTYDNYIKYNTVTWVGVGTMTVGTPSVFKRSVGIYSKAFYRDDFVYFTAAYQSVLQPTYFTLKSNGQIVTKMLPGTGGGLSSRKGYSVSCTPTYTGYYILPLEIATQLKIENGGTTITSTTGIQRARLSFNLADFDTDTLGQNFHVAGGIVMAYDGISATELGFHLFPENISTAQGISASLADGTYNYRVVYEWIDGKGQLHQSAPSITVTKVVAAGGGTAKVTLTVPTLRLTEKTGTRTDINVVLYRAAVGLSTVYYRMSTTGTTIASVYNDPTADTVALVDGGVGFSTSSAILYTTGGVLENTAPPSCSIVHNHKNRLFLAGLEDENAVIYGKQHIYGEGVAFTDSYNPLRTAPMGGPVRALGTLDDKLVIFKKDRIYSVVGEGPLDTGAQDDYQVPQEVSGDTGCDNQRSVVTTPMGLMFKSDKGIKLLNRSLEIEDIGADVGDFDHLTITSAAVVEDFDEVRFTTSDGVALVYNYMFKEWGTFTNYTAVSACISNGSYLHLKSNGTVNEETPDEYNDNGSKIKMAMETSWLSLAGIQGYQRIYYISVLGDFVSNHYTNLKLAYNFESCYNESVYFNTVTGLAQTTYGTDDYGEESPYGGSGSSVYQFRWKPRQQKCESMKIRLEDIDSISTNGGGSFNLVSIALQAGVKVGLNKMGSSKTIG